MEANCLFCKIVSGEIPSSKVYEDDSCLAFKDISPQAPVHILIIPKIHIESLANSDASHDELLGRLLGRARSLAKDLGVDEAGYRVVINTNGDGGQTVFHLHLHLLAGRTFIFPPG